MRAQFAATTNALLDENPRLALVLAEIGTAAFSRTAARYPDRVFSVGIREQLMTGAAGGLALTGMRPMVHSYATFAVDRSYEQLKLDFGHQDVGAVVVSVGASYDGSEFGYTHFSPGDVALFDTLPGWTVHVPGHPDEVPGLLRAAAARDDRTYVRLSTQHNPEPYVDAGGLVPVRRGSASAPLVVAVGPTLGPALAATDGWDATVAYTHTPRPCDTAGLRTLLGEPARVVLVEPYLAGTSATAVARALIDVPHQLLPLGVGAQDLHRYGTPADHTRWHGLDTAGLRHTIGDFLTHARRAESSLSRSLR